MTAVPGRPFRLHPRHAVVDGFLTADGWAVAIDDPEYGLTTAAPSVEDLIRGYGGGRIEWAPDGPQHTAPPAQQGDPR
ncbi:hypothetical protein [Streptomyces longwoodensis]|uniref:hypothetical protein n=1 Tax=Streptomyces longwoodensis TaxID=68231 RepID=UPI00224FAAA2|nr:hypothetical protein [Streptomyces longwoodensis]MCX4993821.1 hypothetical protein [Streptomyces longwoodensis]MCX4998059.1 hypothetical protein [Streptomyces longwoodensis]